MNARQGMIDKRSFRITVLAAAAVVVLAVAAYLFGTGLRADTPASVAPSPLGSSLAVVGEARSAYVDGSSSVLAWDARLASGAVAGKSGSAYVDGSSGVLAWDARLASGGAKSSQGGGSATGQSPWIKPEGIQASGAVESADSQSPWIKPEGIKPFAAK